MEDLAHQILAFGASLYESIAAVTAVDSESIRRLALEYGHYIYLLIFLWTFFEGETCVIIAGVVASQDYLDWTPLFLVAWFGSFSGDQLYFWIGRRWGVRLLDRIPRWRPGVEMALDFLRRYNTTFILSFRFIYGIRNVAPFAIGNAGVRPLRYFTLNMIAALIWAFSFGGSGYLFGDAFTRIMGDVKHYEYIMIGFLVTVLLIVFLSFKIAGWRKRRAEAEAAAKVKVGAR